MKTKIQFSRKKRLEKLIKRLRQVILHNLQEEPINLTPAEAEWVSKHIAAIMQKNLENLPFPQKLAELSSELQELWKEKYEFSQSVLKLNKQKAQEAALRTIQACQESELS